MKRATTKRHQSAKGAIAAKSVAIARTPIAAVMLVWNAGRTNLKLDMSFKIDLSRNKPCAEGGIQHSEKKIHDNFGMTIGYRCVHCDAVRMLKKRRRRVTTKGVLFK